jgi:hypothetical protein
MFMISKTGDLSYDCFYRFNILRTFMKGDAPSGINLAADFFEEPKMIRKLKSGEYRLYSRKVDPKTGKRRNLGTFKTREAAEKHEREVQYFKRQG